MKQIITISKIVTPIGLMLAGATKKGICILKFTDPQIIETQQKKLEKYFISPWKFLEKMWFRS